MSNSNYSFKERMVAKMLSNVPVLKRFVKFIYVQFNAVLYKKGYKIKKIDDEISFPKGTIQLNEGEESFFGYYDKSPVNKDGWVINHISIKDTGSKINDDSTLGIVLSNIHSGEIIKVGETSSYTWQQGSRAQWIDSESVIYNDYDEKKELWLSKVFSIITKRVDSIFDLPVQDVFHDQYLLALNYRRLYTITEDYGYSNLNKLDEKELFDLDSDGITIMDFKTGEYRLLLSLRDIINIDYKDEFLNAIHTVNHIMINKAGTHFIFIHRYYRNGVRKDRLMIYDFRSLKVLSNNEMVSHCCWFDDKTVYGYLRYNNKDGYYFINIDTLEFTLNDVVFSLGIGDGHPSVFGNLIVFDTYPDKSRMQSLFIYNKEKDTVIKILEVFQDIRFKESSRCDLHPRFSHDGNFIFFDSVFEGKRSQYYITLNNQ